MIINYIDAEIRFAQKGKVKQSVKLSEWAHNELRKRKENK